MKVLAILLALAVPPAVYFPTLGAQHDRQQAQADEELRQIDQRVNDVRSAQQGMQEFMEEDAQVTRQLEDYRITLPPKLSTSDILRAIESAATSSGGQLIRFAPRQPTQSAPLQVISIEAEVEGPLPALEQMLKQLGDKPTPGQRFLTLSGINTNGTRTSFVVTGYALPEAK